MPSEQLATLGLSRDRKSICLYHNDPDGCCAAAIVRHALGSNLELEPLEIGEDPPWELLQSVEQVILVDFSLPPEAMDRLRDDWAFVWIDHHKTALASLGREMTDVPGQRSLDEAACVLTWQTFFPGRDVPRAVAYIGDRDIWRNALPQTKAFSEGLYQHDFSPSNWELWQPLLADDDQQVEALIDRGQLLYDARMKQIRASVLARAFETVFEGHRTLAINERGSGDMGEHIRQLGYEIAYCYAEVMRAGRLQTIVTLYSDQVDVSEIARKHGGGGHRGAAGFQFDRSDRPFPPGSETPPEA